MATNYPSLNAELETGNQEKKRHKVGLRITAIGKDFECSPQNRNK